MIVKKLNLKNFRGFAHLDIDFDNKVNVLVGVNGAGKSSVLDGIAIMLSRVSAAIISPKASGRQFSEDDIKNGFPSTINYITAVFNNNAYTWSVAKTRRGKAHEDSSSLQGAREIAENLVTRLTNDSKNASLPLLVYYPVNRAVLDIPWRIRGKHIFDQIASYDNALTGAQNNFRIFFEWFRNREDIENENIRKDTEEGLFSKVNAFRDIQLEAVRKAIVAFLPGFSKLRVKRQPLRMTVEKDGQELLVSQLSDGEKCALALVGDLARRLALANPSMADPLQGQGIVLIDEIELHMHPSWQRRIVRAFSDIFPNCQFIISTHSPHVITHVKPESLFLLKQMGSEILVERPEESYGKTVDRILEDLMGLETTRPDAVNSELHEVFNKIKDDELSVAKELIDSLKNKIGKDSELAKAEVLIRRKEIIGK